MPSRPPAALSPKGVVSIFEAVATPKDTIQAVLTGRADARFDDSTAAGYYEQTSNGKLVVAPESTMSYL
ncbi:hypothetical protein [Rhizobium leguminosarum]|uniref:hypothetical protein n=1 Tax=Rhizobium leguminosarum TaxID=384 RepID=UPI001FDA7C0B|nr:hypothetical protein [Rhizobium leguminosarum]